MNSSCIVPVATPIHGRNKTDMQHREVRFRNFFAALPFGHPWPASPKFSSRGLRLHNLSHANCSPFLLEAGCSLLLQHDPARVPVRALRLQLVCIITASSSHYKLGPHRPCTRRFPSICGLKRTAWARRFSKPRSPARGRQSRQDRPAGRGPLQQGSQCYC